MLKEIRLFAAVVLGVFLLSCSFCASQGNESQLQQKERGYPKINRTQEEWKKILPPEVYHITREAGTEVPFTGKYWDNKQTGIYVCICCDLELFNSTTKYKSGTGWPSFYDISSDTSITEITEGEHGWIRTEVICAQCNAHLGHVFDDGPSPTGLRYCINSTALNFHLKK